MKVLCSACEAAEARVLCCADEAALCARCDRDVHAANRLAGKHRRLPLLSPADAAAPNCDICQESHAYFFCVEDRALLCRSCDVAVHTANAFVSAHRRFLLTGVQVGLQPDAQQHEPPNASAAAEAPLRTPPPPTQPAKKRACSPAPLYRDDDIDWPADPDVAITGSLPDWSVADEQFSAPVPKLAEPGVTKTPSKRSPRPSVAAAFGGQGGLAGGMPDWPLDDFFGLSELNAGLSFAENTTSKGKITVFTQWLRAGSCGAPAGRRAAGRRPSPTPSPRRSRRNSSDRCRSSTSGPYQSWSSSPRRRPQASTGTRDHRAATPPTRLLCSCQTFAPRRANSVATPPPASCLQNAGGFRMQPECASLVQVSLQEKKKCLVPWREIVARS